MLTDPIANMLTIIKNGLLVKKEFVLIPFSKIKFGIALILKKEGFITDVIKRGRKNKKYIKIVLKYDKTRTPAIKDLKRISKPGRRVYVGKNEIYPVKQGVGISIISTPKGLMTNKEAKKQGVGGEIIAEIW